MNVQEAIDQLSRNPKDVRFSVLKRVCDMFFGQPRQRGTSHLVYKMPWPSDPRVNIQDNRGKTKTYQVLQVIKALERLKDYEH